MAFAKLKALIRRAAERTYDNLWLAVGHVCDLLVNTYIERYNRTVRSEWLSQYILETIEEAQDQATQWLWTYNNERPKVGFGGMIPAMKLKKAA